jgi:hypothetical protein
VDGRERAVVTGVQRGQQVERLGTRFAITTIEEDGLEEASFALPEPFTG